MNPASLTPAQLVALGMNLVINHPCSIERIHNALKHMQESESPSIDQLRRDLFGFDADQLEYPLGAAQQASLRSHNKVFDETLYKEWSKQLVKLLLWKVCAKDISGDEIRKMFQVMNAPDSPIGNLARAKRDGNPN